MAYAILRIKKLKQAQLAAAAAHLARSRPTPNADPKRGIETLTGADPEADVARLLPERRRRDATVAVEFMLSASPEYFRPHDIGAAGTWDEKRMRRWSTLAFDWLQRRNGPNLAYASLHLDEATPHVQSLVVPLTAEGRLSARDLFGPAQLRMLQTDYAAAMKPLGLRRGNYGSKARHEEITKYYARVSRSERAVSVLPSVQGEPPPVEQPAMADRVNPRLYAERAARRAYDAGFRAGARAQAEALRWAIAKASEFDAVRKRLERREAALEELRLRAETLREIPLRKLLVALGCTPDDLGTALAWSPPAGRITLNRDNLMQWFNHDQGKGGGGAIDLVKHLSGWNFRQTVSWLGARFDRELTISSARAWAAQKIEEIANASIRLGPASEVPRPCPEAEGEIRDYLVRKLCLLEELIERALKEGRIFATRYGRYTNAVFTCRAPADPDGPIVGVELCGITGTPYRGVRGGGVFIFGEGTCREIAVCDSAIEALSYAALHDRPGLWVVGIAADPSAGVEIARRFADQGVKIFAAHGAAEMGKRPAKRFLNAVPEATRQEPPGAESWNELLLIRNLADRLENAGVVGAAGKEPENPSFVRVGCRWVGVKQPELTAITDHEDFLAINDSAPEAIRFAIDMAAARWGKVRACGSDEFRRTAWHEAVALGLTIEGYQPTPQETLWAEAIKLRSAFGSAASLRERDQPGTSHSTSKNGK